MLQDAALTADRLKSDVMSGAHISASYFYMKCVSQVEKYPWCIARGDQYTNFGIHCAQGQSRSSRQLLNFGDCSSEAFREHISKQAYISSSMHLGQHLPQSKAMPWVRW